MMRWKPRGWTLIGALLAVPCVVAMITVTTVAQVVTVNPIATTQVTDTVYRADGTAAGGTVIVSWGAFTTPTGQSVPGGSTAVTIGTGGVLSVALASNAGATPMGSYYTVVYHLDDGTVSREYWVIPVSSNPVALNAIRSTVLPTSVAMQTVSKAYVDTAITAAVAGHPLSSSSPYVLLAGDTMTGPLILPGDPTATLQAADKHYVDTSVSSLTSGLGQKVSTLPSATQVVSQPAGSQLDVNLLNGREYASQYVTGRGDNGIANAMASPDCSGGCEIEAEESYNSGEIYRTPSLNSSNTGGTHVEDSRNGERRDSYMNPTNLLNSGQDAGQVIDVASTRSAASAFQRTGAADPASIGLLITHEGLTGGSNLFPGGLESTVPYFKSTYSALTVNGNYNTMGQHVLTPQSINCYGVGDCLMGSQFLTASGGFRDDADEGAHPFDLQIQEDSKVFQGTCSAGCSAGSTVVTISPTSAAGTQGEGRFLIDKSPAYVLTTGALTGYTNGVPGAGATFTGTAFGVSVFLQTGQAIPSQANDIAPGMVTVAIASTGVPTGFATNTAALPTASGVACVVDVPGGFAPNNYEMVNFSVLDGTHLQMTLNKVHAAGATIAVGGLCGYGLEQTVDTTQGIRQVFPVIGSFSGTGLYYAAGNTPIVGRNGQTSAYLNVSLPVAAIARSGNVVTVTTAGNLPVDAGGLTMTVAGVADSSYNGSYAVTSIGPNAVTYSDTGANSTSAGGSISIVTGGYALYPMAEVLGVFNASTKAVDGQMTLAPNNVNWAANDVVEQPHYYQENVAADTEFVTQVTPRPAVIVRAGIQYQGNVGPGLHGWVIANMAAATNYLGHGGTHTVPDTAYESTGMWLRTMNAQAGEQAAFSLHCNSHGCGSWNSGYNLFELDSNAGVDTMFYQPVTSSLTLNMRGSGYSFAPSGFTAGVVNASTLNVGTVNATTVNGALSATQLPVFGASGSGHAQGAVPDPGATTGATRYLREDGTWVVPTGGSGSGVSSGPALLAGAIADYNFLQGSGTVLTDNSGSGNNGALGSGASAPTWTSNGLTFGLPQNVSLPVTLNAAKTLLMVVYINPLANSIPSNVYPALVTSSTGASGLNLLYVKTGNSTTFVNQSYAPTVFGNSTIGTAANTVLSGFHAIAITLGTTGTSVDHMYVDGVEYPYVSQTASGALQSAGNLYLGPSPAGLWSTSGFIGTYYRFVAYAAPLSASQVVATSGAMVAEVTARGVASTPVPVMLISPQLHAIGDSITSGLGVTTAWPGLMSLSNQPAYAVTNWGIPGIDLESIYGSEGNRVAPQCRSSVGPNVAIVLAGTNDLASVTGATPASVFGFAMGEVQTLKRAGCVVFAGTMLSRTGNDNNGVTMDTDKDAYDALILQQASTAGADGVVDFAANPLLGADGANASATYFQADHVHPTQVGHQQMANAASNALNYYFGYNQLNPHTVTALPYSMTAADGSVWLQGLTGAGTVTLPDCTGQSGAAYRVNNPQAVYAVTVAGLNGSQLINGVSSVVVPANGTVTLWDIPNAKAVSGCHWEM